MSPNSNRNGRHFTDLKKKRMSVIGSGIMRINGNSTSAVREERLLDPYFSNVSALQDVAFTKQIFYKY
jgi:hypothetical protein